MVIMLSNASNYSTTYQKDGNLGKLYVLYDHRRQRIQYAGIFSWPMSKMMALSQQTPA